jgi:hypothetical protein
MKGREMDLKNKSTKELLEIQRKLIEELESRLVGAVGEHKFNNCYGSATARLEEVEQYEPLNSATEKPCKSIY